jgi:hypothetical protein
MISGALVLRRLVHRGSISLPDYSFWLLSVLGTEVDDTQEGSWSQCCEELSLLGH